MDWGHRLGEATWGFLDEHGLLALFLLLLVEEAGTPVPLPGDVLMVLAGVRAAEGRIGLLEALLVMEVATVLGASILYWLSARAGRTLVYRLGRHVGLTPARLDRAAAELHRRGALAVVLGRLTPGLRILTPVACGVFGFPFRIFLPAMAVGAFLYLLAYTLLGYLLGRPVMRLLAALDVPVGLLVPLALLTAVAVWTIRVGRRPAPSGRPDRHERLRAGAAAGLVASVESTLLVNVLVHLLGLLAFSAPGAALGQALDLLGGRMSALNSAGALLLLPSVLLLGSALGAAYGWWQREPARGGPLHGVRFALLPLAGSLLVVLPIAGAGLAGLGLGAGPLPAVGEVVRHLVYGAVLGTLYPALARPGRRSHQVRRRRQPRSPEAQAAERVEQVA